MKELKIRSNSSEKKKFYSDFHKFNNEKLKELEELKKEIEKYQNCQEDKHPNILRYKYYSHV